MTQQVLVVEDEPDVAYVTGLVLRSEGYDVLSASGVGEALGVLATNEPNLVLLDLRLEDGEGWDVLRSLQEEGRRVPVVIVSAHASPATIARAMKDGAVGYVTKPFSVDELLSAVARHATSG